MAFGNGREINFDITADDKASRVFSYVSNNIHNMSTKFNTSVNSMNKALISYNNAMNDMHRITQIAVGGAAYSIYRFTKDSINSFAEFERQHAKTMGAIASNYDRSIESQRKFMEDQQKLKQQSIQLGTVGPTGKGALYNPTETASAQTALVKSGMTSNDVMTALPSILKFAGGNDLDLTNASEYAVQIASMFDITADKWGNMLDKITRAADKSVIDVPDIFESLKYGGPIAASMGRPLEEVLSLIEIMGNAGLKGSMSGTGIQAFFTRILSPVGKTEKAMNTAPTEYAQQILESFVKESADANGKFKPMAEVTDMLDQAYGTMNDIEKAWFSQKLFGLFQMKAGYTLSKNGGSAITDAINDLNNNAPGTNDRKWDIMLGTSYGRKEAWSNLWTGTKTDVGERISPATNSILTELFNFISSNGNYKIDFDKINSSFEEAGSKMGDRYGSNIGSLTERLGKFGVTGSRIAVANEPLVEGMALGGLKLLSGDPVGAIREMAQSVGEVNTNIDGLPPDLQQLAREVKNVTLLFMTLSAVNFAARLLENISTVYKYTLGKMVAKNVNVTAGSVVVSGKAGTPGTGGVVAGTGAGTTLSKGAKIAGGAIGVYSILELLGVNDAMLDKMGVQGDSRKLVDGIRTGIDNALTVALADSVLFQGAGRKLAGTALTGIINGAKTGVGAAILEVGPLAAGLGGLLISSMIGIILQDMQNQMQTKKELDNVMNDTSGSKWIVNTRQNNPWYDPNGIMTHNQEPSFVNVDEIVNKHLEGSITQAQPSFFDKVKSWLSSGMLIGSTSSAMAQGQVNVSPPNVTVNVTVDKQGNQTTSKYIDFGTMDTFDNLWRLNHSRDGG